MEENNKHYMNMALVILLSLIGISALFGCYYVLEPGETAIHLRMGSMIKCTQESGTYFKMPFIDSIKTMNNRIQKVRIETESLSKDLQFVSIGVALNYQISDALNLFKDVGTDFEKIIIDPLAQESIKAIVACYTAEELIQHRHEAKDKVLSDIKTRLIPRYINLIDFNFVHLDFHDEFMKAVENKQIAQQSAMAEKNLTEKVREEMLQKRLQSETEVYNLKIKKEALTPELLELKKIEKWDGRLPQVTGNATPFINLR